MKGDIASRFATLVVQNLDVTDESFAVEQFGRVAFDVAYVLRDLERLHLVWCQPKPPNSRWLFQHPPQLSLVTAHSAGIAAE